MTTDGNKSYKIFYRGKFHHERRYKLGIYQYDQFSNENGKKTDGEAESKMGFSGHHKKKGKKFIFVVEFLVTKLIDVFFSLRDGQW